MGGKASKEQVDACGGDKATEKCPLRGKITVTVRMAFFNPEEGECLSQGKEIVGATIAIKEHDTPLGQTWTTRKDNGTTGLPPKVERWRTFKAVNERAVGLAEVDLKDLVTGEHELEMEITPPGTPTTAPAGTSLKNDKSGQHRFRRVHIRFKLVNGKLTERPVVFDPSAPAGGPAPPITHARVVEWDSGALHVDWKPDWIVSKFTQAKRPPEPSLIVLHRSGGEPISGVIQTGWSDNESEYKHHGWHYLLDHDGHVTKFVDDDKETANAGPGRWGGVKHVNGFLVGIELIPHLERFTEGQYLSLIRLIRDLVDNLGIAAYRIVGHTDVDVADDGQQWLMDGARDNDPGTSFEWNRIEAEGFGMIPDPAYPQNQGWAAYFAKYPDALRSGDADRKTVTDKKSKKDVKVKYWGGATRDDDSLDGVVRGLQEDLIQIGYSIPKATGEYDRYTAVAVRGFQRHFFSGSRQGDFPGNDSNEVKQVNAKVAHMVQSVASFVKAAAARDLAEKEKKKAAAAAAGAAKGSGDKAASDKAAADKAAADKAAADKTKPPGGKGGK